MTSASNLRCHVNKLHGSLQTIWQTDSSKSQSERAVGAAAALGHPSVGGPRCWHQARAQDSQSHGTFSRFELGLVWARRGTETCRGDEQGRAE